jgi:WD40 repeat protein
MTDTSANVTTASSERAVGAERRYDVFLSHNGKDKPLVERIAALLKRERLEPWLDRWDLTAGVPWRPELDRALHDCHAVAVFVGPHGLSGWSRYESFVAIDRAAQDDDFRLVPVLLPGLPEPFDPTTLPDFLSARTWVDLRRGIDGPESIQDLINGIKGVPPRAALTIEPTPSDCPYLGLQTFNEGDARFFFGREADIQRLIEQLKGWRLLTVLGPSGVGKSSVVRAGLIPALRRGDLPGSQEWQIEVHRPGALPLSELASQLARLAPGEPIGSIRAQLASDRRTLARLGEAAMSSTSPGERIVWVIDQLEEVFTLCHDEDEREAFIHNLLHAATVPDGRTLVVLTMRADFYPRCAAFPELAAQMAGHQYLISPLSRDGLRQAIVEPARQVGLELERGLAKEILDDVHDQPGALPLLEHALKELWERRRGRLLTLEGYHESGGVREAIGQTADQVFRALTFEQQSLVRQVLLRLIRVDDASEETRRRVALADLAPSTGSPVGIELAVQPFVERRLLTTSVDDVTGRPVLEVAHEALIGAWPELRGWIQAGRADLIERSQLIDDTERWRQRGRDESVLYRGLQLDRALQLRFSDVVTLNDDERAFVAAAEELRERQQRNRRRVIQGIAIAVALFGVAIIGALIWALAERGNAIDNEQLANQQRGIALQAADERATAQANAEDERDTATSRELAAKALQLEAVNPNDDPQLRLLLAREALRIADSPEAREALRQVLFAVPVLPATSRPDESMLLAYNDDYSVIVTVSDPDTITVRDTMTGGTIAVLTGDVGNGVDDSGWPAPVRLSPDASRVLTVTHESTVRLWDASGGTQREPIATLYDFDRLPAATVLGEGCGVNDAFFSPDGARVLVTADDGRALIFDARTGDQLVTLGDAADPAHDGWWSPDGTLVFTTSSPYCYDLIGKPAGEAEAATAEVWDARTGALLAELPNPPSYFRQIFFTPDSSKIVTFTFGENEAEPDVVHVWEARSGREIRKIAEHWLSISTISPDGTAVVMAGEVADAQLWDLATGTLIRTFIGHQGQLWTAAFSPDGTFLATVSSDTTARVWNARTGDLVARTYGQVQDVSFSPDGQRMLTKPISYPWRVSDFRVFATAPLDALAPELLALAEERITREFTSEERQQYLHE